MLRTLIFTAALACAAPAHAERFALEYNGHAFGVAPVGKVTFDFTIDGEGYDVVSTVRSGGVLKMVGKQDVTGKSEGAITNGLPRWTSYVTTTETKRKTRTTTITRNGEAVTVDVQPHYGGLGDPPASEAQKRAAYDPLNVFMAMGMQAQRTKTCAGRFPTFDGRYYYDLVLSPDAGIQNVKEGGYSGPALKCKMQQVPIAGYDAQQKAEQKANPPNGALWFALVNGAQIAPPIRMLLPVPATKVNLTLSAWRAATVKVDTEAEKPAPNPG
jgi:Protein of unknown function (DUF3108)